MIETEMDMEKFWKNMRQYADSDIIGRGKAYASQGKVYDIDVDIDGGSDSDEERKMIVISGRVKGSMTYDTELLVDIQSNDIDYYECSCPYNDIGICKHVVALAYAAFEEEQSDSAKETQFSKIKKEQNGDIIKTEVLDLTKLRNECEVKVKEGLVGMGIGIETFDTKLLIQLTDSLYSKEYKSLLERAESSDKAENKNNFKYHEKKSIKKSIDKAFNERYKLVISIGSRVGSYSLRIKDKKAGVYYDYSRDEIAKINKILKEEYCTEDEKLLLSKIIEFTESKNRDYYNKEKDKRSEILHDILLLAKKISVAISVDKSYDYKENKNILIWKDEGSHVHKLKVKISLENRQSFSEKYKYREFLFDFSGPLINDACLAVVKGHSIIIFDNKSATEYSLPNLLANILARAISGEYYSLPRFSDQWAPNKTKPFTILKGVEYLKLNEILAACKEHTDVEFSFDKNIEFIIKEYEAKSLFIIDYIKENKLLTIIPSVDFGGEVIPLRDMIFYNKDNSKYRRREDECFGDTHFVRIKEAEIEITPRIEKEEVRFYKLLRNKKDIYGLSQNGKTTFRGEKQIKEFVQNYKKNLESSGIKIVYEHDEPQEVLNTEFKANFDIDFDKDNDWLAFDIELYCGEERVQLSDIESCLVHGDSQVTMKDGRILRITNIEALRKLINLLSHFRKNDNGQYEGKTYHAPELDAMANGSPHYTMRVSRSFAGFIKEAKTGKLVKKVKIPSTFAKVLRDYQADGVQWLHFLHQYKFAGVLADDMGLGKTLQALAILSIHKEKGKPSLVIAPKTLIHNWQEEAARFAPNMKVMTIDSDGDNVAEKIKSMAKYDLVVTSYPRIARDIELYHKSEICFNYCVLDEAQYVKNPHTEGSHVVREIRSDHRLALTGTPLENGVREIWSLFDFLMPGFLGSHKGFQEKLGNPIMKHGNKEALETLKTKIKCFMMRRTKEEVLKDLPAKVEEAITCNMSDEQNLLYQDVLKRVKKDITEQVKEKGFAASQIHILAGLTKLRQICNHPSLVLPVKKRGEYPSAKLDKCIEILDNLLAQNRKVLVFSQFTGMIDILSNALEKRKIKHSVLTGQSKKRKDIVNNFINDESVSVFLISIKAGGVGLNLTIADAVIIFDPWWNPQVERQAIDRTHRIGQSKVVDVYRLRTVGTIEEKIIALQDRKQKLFDALVSDSKDLFKKLTWEDVKGLLTE